jgi:signal transduction histidine kinase
LSQVEKYHPISVTEMEIVIDSSASWNIQDVLSPNIQYQFNHAHTSPYNASITSAYWIRIHLSDTSHKVRQWILESHNYRINELSIFIPEASGSYQKKEGGVDLPFSVRETDYKNIQFFLNEDHLHSGYYYIRYKSGSSAPFQFVIRSLKQFSTAVSYEYFVFGLYYGMLLIIAIYSFFLFRSFKDKALLYYIGYVIFAALFSMCHDGLSFQYLWPNMPFLNNYVFIIAVMCMTIMLFLYTYYFLPIHTQYPWIVRWIVVYIIIRMVLYFICLIWFSHIRHLLYIDLMPLVLSYTLAIRCYIQGYKPALYIVIGHSIIIIAYLLGLLRLFNIITPTFMNVYAINIAVVVDILLLSVALGRRIRLLKEKEFLNLQLEEKIKERAEAMILQKDIIREKIDELNTYIYRTAHDISGPLKSIQGLTNLGLIEPHNALQYLILIQKTSTHLDEIVNDLYRINVIHTSTVDVEIIQVDLLLERVLDALKEYPSFNKLEVTLDIQQDTDFYSGDSLVYLIFHNLIENAIEYRDHFRNAQLHISVRISKWEAILTFTDNGIGINEEYKDKIFQMFFKLTSETGNAGLGLYIVKLASDKLSGSIRMYSSSRAGTTFQVVLKNLSPDLS